MSTLKADVDGHEMRFFGRGRPLPVLSWPIRGAYRREGFLPRPIILNQSIDCDSQIGIFCL